MKTKFYFLLLFAILASCNNKSTIEEVLISKPNEYWTYYNPNSSDFTYYRFGEDQKTQRYYRDNKNKFLKYSPSGDAIEVSQKWSVSQDSILRFNSFVYDVVSYNENSVVLYFRDQNTKQERMIFLTKEKAENPRNFSDFFQEKRKDNPQKYKVPDAWWTSK